MTNDEMGYWELILDCPCHSKGQKKTYNDPHHLFAELSREHGSEYAADALLCARPATETRD